MLFKLLKIGRARVLTRRIGRSALVAAAICVATAPSSSWAATNITENVTLDADTDWSDQGTVTIAEGVTLDLNGYSLTVSAIDGAGSIIDSLAAAGYKRLEYIASDGKAQYIDTEDSHNASTIVDMRIQFNTVAPQFQAFYGARTGGNASQFGGWVNYSQFRYGYGGNSASNYSAPVVNTATIYDVHLNKSGQCTVVTNGVVADVFKIGSGNSDNTTLQLTDFLFAINQGSDTAGNKSPQWHANAKIYSCVIKKNGAIAHNFIPVKKLSNGETGMYDSVTGKFHVSGNKKDFVGGPVAAHGLRLTPSGGAASDFSGLTIGAGVALAFTGDVALSADLDATVFASVEVAEGATLDLAGHNLTVNSITGDGLVTDTVGTALAGYERLEFIKSTGTQYIDTAYIHDNSTKVDMRIKFDSVSQEYQSFYGARNSKTDTAKGFSLWLNYAKFRRAFGGSAGNIDSHTVSTSTIYDIHLDKSGACTATPEGGEAIDLGSGTQGDSLAYTDYLFAINQYVMTAEYTGWRADFRTSAKLYLCKIYSGTTLVRDFVPVRRKADNALGMLDLVEGKFYGNAGGGSFTAPDTVVSTTPGGELHITVAEGATASFANMAKISGSVKVIKDGAGTLTLPASGTCFVGGLEVAGGTLSMTQTPINFLKTPIAASAGGTIEIAATGGASYANDFTIAGGTLKVLASGTGNTTTAAIAGTLALELGANDAQPAVSIDMTDCSSATFVLNTTALTAGTGVTAAPGFVSLADTTTFEASVDGASIKVERLTSPAIAVWTGRGVAGDFDDPDNWSCSNKNGVALSNTTLPDLSGSTLTFRLGMDADWTAKGAIALGAGVVLDLAGHNLTATSITGAGVVIDSSDNFITASDGSVYQKIQYVQATQDGANNSGGGQSDGKPKIQYVDTEYYHVGTTKVDIRVEFQDVSYSDNYGYATYYGCRNNGDNATHQLGGWLHNSKFYYYDTSEQDGATAYTGRIYDIRLDKGDSSYANYADGTLASTLGTGNGAGESNTYGTDYIFANNQVWNGGKYWPCKCRVYSCKVYTGDTPERDFVPVRRVSGTNPGEAGFWCNVTKKFYGNSGYGSLTAGPAVQSETAGELHITVAEGATLSLANTAKIAGNVKIVKDGLGTLVAPTTGHYFVGGIDVTAGTLSMDGALAYGGTIDAAAGTTVSVPKSVGSAGTSVVNIAGGTLDVANCGTSLVDGTVTLGGNAISVAGSFVPVSGTAAHTITLADGATLDFTQWTGKFPIAYPTLAYASGANITVKLEPATTALTALARSKDAETGKRNGYLFSWDSPPTDVTFSSDAATGARFRVVPDENGLRVSFKAGLAIIIM